MKFQSNQLNNSGNPNKHILHLINEFQINLYNNISRAIRRKDKLIFSFLICTKLMSSNNKLKTREIKHLIIESNANPNNQKPNPDKIWLLPKTWSQILELTQLFPDTFDQYFLESFCTDIQKIKAVMSSDNCQEIIDTQFQQPS